MDGFDHVERIEQCGNRTVVTAGGVIHDFFTDGTVANGSRDIEAPSCVNTWVSIEWEDEVMKFHPFGLPYTIVTRACEGDHRSASRWARRGGSRARFDLSSRSE